MPATTPPSPGILATIATVFRQNRLPCLLLNGLVIALVASYYCWPAVAGIWETIGGFKTRWSYAFSLVSTILAAAVMPYLINLAMGTLPVRGRIKRLAFLSLFWGYRGMEIDLFYRLQGWLFGNGNELGTLLKKIAMDQFVCSPIWFVPSYLIVLRWIDFDCSWPRTRASLDRNFWLRTCPTIMVANWIVWIPALALVYSLPAPLQFPLFSVVMCFFILIITLLARVEQE